MSWTTPLERDDYYDNSLNDDKLDSIDVSDASLSSSSSKYASLGFSSNSQHLICEFYSLLSHELPGRASLFEDILHSFLDDIQTYKNDAKRLEISYKNEKEKNDDTIKQVIEEAERQLSIMSEKLKQQERQEYEKSIDKMRLEYDSQIAFLKERVSKLQELEKRFCIEKKDDNVLVNELKSELQSVSSENQDLQMKLRESYTKMSLLRSEIAELRSMCSEGNVSSDSLSSSNSEITKLKAEIDALQEANKRLSDANDILQNKVNAIKLKRPPNLTCEYDASVSEAQMTMSSIEMDEDVDSGYMASPNKLSESHCETDSITGAADLSSQNVLQAELETKSSPKPFLDKLLRTNSNKQLALVKSESVDSDMMKEKTFKVVLAGDSAVGKTSFIMRYCKGSFVETTSFTLGIDFYTKTVDLEGKKICIQLCDTCGQERFRSLSKSYFRRAEGAVLMYDCTYDKSFASVKEWIKIINETTDKKIPIVIVANKIDLREESRKVSNAKVIDREEGEKLANEFECLFLEASAKDGTNMDEPLLELCRKMNSNTEPENEMEKSEAIKLAPVTTKKKRCC